MTNKESIGRGFDAVLGDGKKSSQEKREAVSSQNDRVAFVIRKDTLEKVRAFAWYNRVKLKDFLNNAIEAQLEKDEASLKKALREYRKLA